MRILINLIHDEQVSARLKQWPKRSGAQRLREMYRRTFWRSRGRCVYCGAVEGPFQEDHAVPVVRGGSDRPENRVLACADCNQRKGFKTAAEFGHPTIQVEQPRDSYAEFCRRERRR